MDVLGGGVSVATGHNGLRQAWGPDAVLAAPLPMMAAQVAFAVAADRWDDRRGDVAAALLGTACLLSAASGFFDGQLGRRDLPRPMVVLQVVLVTATAGVGLLSMARLVREGRGRAAR
jgi:hypothetical protein